MGNPGRHLTLRWIVPLLAVCLLSSCSGDTPSAAAAGGDASAGAAEVVEGRGSGPSADLYDGTPLGEGFVVWESNRGGPWRLWTRPLDGSAPPRQLTADEPGGRQHCCPHVSPAGDRLVYLSLPQGAQRYPADGATGELRLLEIEGLPENGGTGQRTLADRARTYFEHRAAVWRDHDTLIFIDGEGRTVEIEVDANPRSSKVLVADAQGPHGWLLDATLGHASQGVPTFSPYDADRRSALGRPNLGGCQPYFTHDGRFGFWIAGAGGPLRAMELSSRRQTTVLAKGDPRLQADRRYLYFPMVSRDGLFLTYGASDGSHDHERADYDVFVAEIDPSTLELVGPPRRVTSHPATDRFPDVWSSPLALGRRFVEGPATLDFAPPPDRRTAGPWRWDFGDGSPAVTGPTASHTFGSPGRYRVTARPASGGGAAGILVGDVRVAEAAPPSVVRAEILDRTVRVSFDEQVAVDGASADLSGVTVTGGELVDDGRTWVLELAEPPADAAVLELRGIRDRAQRPNAAERIDVDLAPPRWPSRRDALVLLWHTGDRTNLVADPGTGLDGASLLKPRGRAWLDRRYRMALRGGSFVGDMPTMERLLAGVKATNELTLEVTIRPAAQRVEGWAPIFEFASGTGTRNATLAQAGDRLTMRLRTPASGKDAGRPVVDLGPVTGKTQHVVVSYSPGRLRAWLDGREAADTGALRSGFFHWRPLPLLVGSDWPGARTWHGEVEGLAVYGRAFGAAEAAENHRRYRRDLESVSALGDDIPRLRLRVALRNRSPTPTLEEIAPYREALAVFGYDVLEVLAGSFDGDTVRVVHRVLLDGQALPIDGMSPGSETVLDLEPFLDQPQLESLFLSSGEEGGGQLWFSDAVDP
ncbi:MAG: LamG-like jellyroll fold domain-containing protein [Acidobacteriota bacterium]